MRNGTRIIVVAALAALVTLSFGQGRRGFGMFGGGGAMPSVALLGRNDVKNDLKLTDDQKLKLSDLQQSMRPKMQEIFQNDQGDRDKIQTDMKAVMDDMDKQVKTILTPEQSTRLQEIRIQLAGNAAANIPEVATAIKLTDDQKSKIADLQKTAQDANQSLFEKVRNQEITPDDMRTTMQKNNDTLNAEIGKVLTDDQKAQLKKMGGAPFTADANPFGGGR